MTKFQIFVCFLLVMFLIHSMAVVIALSRISADIDEYTNDQCGKCYYDGFVDGQVMRDYGDENAANYMSEM